MASRVSACVLYLGELPTVMLCLLMVAAALGTCMGDMSPGSFDAAEYVNWYLLNSGKSLAVLASRPPLLLVDGVVGAEEEEDLPSFSPALPARAEILGIWNLEDFMKFSAAWAPDVKPKIFMMLLESRNLSDGLPDLDDLSLSL